MGKTYKTINAVKVTGKVLKFLAEQKKPVSGQEISRALDIANGTVMCHLATLIEIGFVELVGEHYKLGMGAALLWAKYKSQVESTLANCRDTLATLDA
ncbi:helix-turn-helix domain-containing protein [Desulfuromonas acetoxidans]|uniref:helix-turn-helix domain-containing protein n=1 Tax=Desulfuromonas acetoxidans TaxID=891 RepID=UPI0018835E55|nr:helix-turn-helix domain-containing protein [Desulfuromonas acetoxidans]MBF0647172.1 helix-turn-helix domain-containing protein [Desulfuromonas acetoxidans]